METGKAHWVDNAKLFAAERMARAYVSGVSLCEEAGRPLTGLQQIELMKAALLEFEGIEEALNARYQVEQLLNRLSANGNGDG
jgi:hypothetical protein